MSFRITDLKKIKKVLIVKPSSLGDIIHVFPAFELLKTNLPNAKFDWVVNPNFKDVLSCLGKEIDRKIIFDRKRFKSRYFFSVLFKLIYNVRKEKYDLVIDFQGLMRSSLVTFLTRSKMKIGFFDVREKLAVYAYKEKVKIPENLKHAIEKNIYLACKSIGLNYELSNYKLTPKFISDESFKYITLPQKFIVIAPGARWPSKMWPTSFFAKIADEITSNLPNIAIVIIGSSPEIKIANNLIDLCHIAKPVSFAGITTLEELIYILSRSMLLLTNDSGPMHIAAALRRDVVALFGPTSPVKTGPFWEWNRVFSTKTGCTLCMKRECTKRIIECQESISYRDVADCIVTRLIKTEQDLK